MPSTYAYCIGRAPCLVSKDNPSGPSTHPSQSAITSNKPNNNHDQIVFALERGPICTQKGNNLLSTHSNSHMVAPEDKVSTRFGELHA
eukprot:1190109-Prorocentrum_minimum.AAC.2